MPPEVEDEQFASICKVLADHGVEFIVIGGMAARLHGTGHATVDVDVCPATDESNLRALGTALTELRARLRVEGIPDGIAFALHPDTFRHVTTMTLVTEHGPLDLCFWPQGFEMGYVELRPGAQAFELDDVVVLVASLKDVVASKRAAGRLKDIVALPALEAELRKRSSGTE